MNKKILTCYNTDASRLVGKVEKVAFPKKIGQVQEIVKTSKLDIVPRGAGTGLVGGCIPNNSLILDMGKMNNISDFNPVKKTVRAEAGVTLKELNEKLNGAGFEFPIPSFNYGVSTIGGMVAKNAFGGVRYESIKKFIEEIEFVNGRGELMKTSKADLMDVCGMEGITGVIVAVTLKIMPKTKKSASIFQTDNLDEALSIARRLRLEKEVIMLEVFPPKISRLLGLQEKYHMVIEFSSDRGKIKGEKYKIVSELKEKVYSVLYSKGYCKSEDYKFFFDKLKEFILFLDSNQILYFGFFGAGVIYAFFRDDEEDKRKKMIKLINRVKAKQVGYGIGLTRKYLLDFFEAKIIKRVKLRHDPFGKLNKGKIIDAEPTLKEYVSKEEAQHLKPIGKDEIEEIRPFLEEEIEEIKPSLGEEISASKFKDEIKTPEEKMGEFIEEVAKLDKGKIKGEVVEEKQEVKKEISSEEERVLKDYEQTYESELPEERRKKIEDFAKDVSKNINKKIDTEVEKIGKLSKEEQDTINKVMMGGFGVNNKEGDEEDKNKE